MRPQLAFESLDSAGNAYVTGGTNSTSFPTTPGAFQTTQGNGGAQDNAFVTKLGPGGSSLVYSTYLGGNGIDDGNGIAVDSTGEAYVAGETFSPNFPTVNGFQTSLRGITANTFVSKLKSDGSGLKYSTYLAGNDGGSVGQQIAIDSLGNAYVTGFTGSTSFWTKNALQSTLKGSVNAYVTKIDTTKVGSASLIYSTY